MDRHLARILTAISAAILIATLVVPTTATAQDDGVEFERDLDITVVGGEVISPSLAPWMVDGFCGGTLIAPQWVLSAAHCGNRTGATYRIGAVEQRDVVAFFKPFGGSFNLSVTPDIALWKLDTASSMTPLPLGADPVSTTPGKLVQGFGYGATEPGGGGGDGQLRTTGWVNTTPGRYAWDFRYGDIGGTTCFGDSGGPVVGNEGGELVLVGIVSYTDNNQGVPCSDKAGGTRLTDHLDWIEQTIADNGGPGGPGGPGGTPGDPDGGSEPAPHLAPMAMFNVSCLNGDGRVDTNLVNQGEDTAQYFVELGDLPRRGGGMVAPDDWWRLPITGRADGDYELTVIRDDVVVATTTVTVACDDERPTVTDDEIRVVNACRDGNGYILFQFVNLTDQSRGWVVEFESVRNRSTSTHSLGGSVRAVTGRPNGDHDFAIRVGDDYVATGTVTVNC